MRQVLLSLALVLPAAPSAAQALAFTDVAVVDVEQGTLEPGSTVVVQDGRIRAVGTAAEVQVPEDAARIDAQGRFLIPGLRDMHVHTSSDAITRDVIYPLFAAHGITGVRNMHADCFAPCAAVAMRMSEAASSEPPQTVIVPAPTGTPEADRALITAALAQAREGADVVFSPGTYTIGPPITVRVPGARLIGSGGRTIIRGCDPADFTEPPVAMFRCGGFELAGPDQHVEGFTFEYAWHGVMVGCCFPGSPEELEGGQSFLVRQPGGQTLSGNTFRYNSTGIRVIGSPDERVTITGNRFEDNYHGVTINGSNVTVDGNRFASRQPQRVPILQEAGDAVAITPFSHLLPPPLVRKEHRFCANNLVENNAVERLPLGIWVDSEDGICTENTLRNNAVDQGG